MADVVAAAPAFKKRAKASNIRKRPATPPPDASDSDSDFTDDDSGVRVKRRKKDGLNANNSAITKPTQDLSKSTKFEADRDASIKQSEDATKLSNWYTDAALGAGQLKAKEGSTDGTYKGAAGYGNYIQKDPDRQKNVGPVKAPTNVRTITVTDFAPDVCKDYKLTGFCGFGDTCKFLHARENYKQGWQIDKEWEQAGKDAAAKAKMVELTEEEKVLKDIPFKCIICKEDYKNPVMTKCGHYFCEKCAMQRYLKQKQKTCANCGVDTNGSFTIAKKLQDLLAKKRARAEKDGTQEEEDT
ncbi:hypothetical protein AMS68_005832 [Peltaster fructicola]|uniref:Pre-mRNA-splicing factor CWC24 n=1 Tax=Peltaster fructicola TaxID=286661 RepID=A0A6H0Y076_9PEZI|nr:hypothetical protein AMS68_005832 [Peltaster fructicola]